MRKKNLLLLCAFFTTSIFAQTTDDTKNKTNAEVSKLTTTKELKEGWTKGGTLNVSINEAGRNEYWFKGGSDLTIGLKAIIDYDFDLKHEKSSWLNNIRARYGVFKDSAGKPFVKNDDYLSYTSIYAHELKKKWSYAVLFNLESQFEQYFMSPGSIKLGPGIMYRPSNHFSAIYSPVMMNLATKFADEYRDIEIFGVEAGSTTKLGLGSFLQLKANYDIATGINYKGFATLYSNYLNTPGSIILDWTNLFTLTVNKYIGATVSINVRNNDFEVQHLQLQHAIGVGFNYKL